MRGANKVTLPVRCGAVRALPKNGPSDGSSDSSKILSTTTMLCQIVQHIINTNTDGTAISTCTSFECLHTLHYTVRALCCCTQHDRPDHPNAPRFKTTKVNFVQAYILGPRRDIRSRIFHARPQAPPTQSTRILKQRSSV